MLGFKELSRILGVSVGLLVGLLACIGPDQSFPTGSLLWKKANPAWTGFSEARLSDASARHRVLVAVLDGGIDYNAPSIQRAIHPFRLAASTGYSYGLGWDTLGKDYFPHYSLLEAEQGLDISEDLNVREHGTHVSQLVALTHPGIGLIPIRVLPLTMTKEEDLRSDSSDPRFLAEMAYKTFDRLAEGLRFASDHGAAIVNMSIGISLEEVDGEYRPAVMERLEKTLLTPMRAEWSRMLYVVAAGNEGAELSRVAQSVPATLPLATVLSVGALKNHQTISYFSNRGKYVDVYVRGSDVTSTIPEGVRKKLSGTSMASPLVAHLAAELKIALPELTATELRALIINTSDRKTLAVESDPEKPLTTASAKLPVRVVNMRKAREIAKKLAANPAQRSLWLQAPFEHGQAGE